MTTIDALVPGSDPSEILTLGRAELPLRRFLRRFLAQKVAVAAAAVLFLIVVVAIAAPVLAPVDPNAQDLRARLLPPLSSGHLLGTDHLGRDVLSRLLFGARISLVAALEAVGIGAAGGIVPGLFAGYVGRWLDWVVMRWTDALMSFPPVILAIAVIAALGPGLTNAMIAVGVVFSPRFARIARGAVLAVREETFVEAARSMGLPTSTIVRRHILPHVLSPLIVTASVLAGVAMVVEAGLSFVGLGVQPPQSSWGSMLASSFRFMANQPTLILWPGLCIIATVLALNLLGDGIRDALGREVRRG
jgi:ABC-type dipeptide/oligopeptide/nickel transport system permease subunit